MGWPDGYLAIRSVPVFSPGPLSPIPVLGEATPVAAALSDSLIALANEQSEYRVRVIDRSGRAVRQICRSVEPMPFSPAERSGLERMPMPEVVRSIEAAEPSPNLAPLGRLIPDRSGGRWVQRDRASLFNSLDRWFGPAGRTFRYLSSRRPLYGRDCRALGRANRRSEWHHGDRFPRRVAR